MSQKYLDSLKGATGQDCICFFAGDDDSSMDGSCCCACASARISKLEQQVKELQLSSSTDTKTLDDWTAAAQLHPVFKGNWAVHHCNTTQGMTIGDTTATFTWQGSEPEHLIERLAPYAFHLHHHGGRSLLVLLPCLAQVVEVNYEERHRLLWVKKPK